MTIYLLQFWFFQDLKKTNFTVTSYWADRYLYLMFIAVHDTFSHLTACYQKHPRSSFLPFFLCFINMYCPLRAEFALLLTSFKCLTSASWPTLSAHSDKIIFWINLDYFHPVQKFKFSTTCVEKKCISSGIRIICCSSLACS